MSKYKLAVYISTSLIAIMFLIAIVMDLTGYSAVKKPDKKSNQVRTARVVANGDILYHDILYTSAKKADGTYDFAPYFKYVKEYITAADLAIGDYEGTVSDKFPLAGYPLFNAPVETIQMMKETGYDVADLAHNHILDSHLSGALNTKKLFNDLGMDTVGIYTKNRQKDGILVKEVNGIKIAILAYAYGYNGMESLLTKEEYQNHLADLDPKQIKKDIKEAEQLADVTIVMPQMGVEYALEPTQEQVDLYHKMIDWGADVIFGGHPHVIEPSEVVTKDGERKFIIYSMGNFISNQSFETLGNVWTERGLLMDVTFEKKGQKTKIKAVKAHPTMVWSWPKDTYAPEGYQHKDYRVMLLEDFIKGGKYRDELPDSMKERVDTAYKDIKELVNLQW